MHVIPSVARDLTKGRVSRYFASVLSVAWEGSLALLGMTRVSVKRLCRIVRAVAILAICAFTFWLLLPKPALLDGIPFSQCVRDRNGKLLRITLASDQKFRVFTPLRQISPSLVDATLRYEDKFYMKHPGVNPMALARSALDYIRFRHIIGGGSTITMQVARLRFHLQTRTVWGKCRQMIYALELERHYSKEQILEAYLNLAPYGRNIEGAGAASEIYLGKSSSQLTSPEAVALSVIPQSPSRRHLLADQGNQSVNRAQANWYKRSGGVSDGQFSNQLFQARAQSENKMIAPHFVRQILDLVGTQRCGVRSTQRADPTIRPNDNLQITTTLDLEKQKLIERRVTDYITTNQDRGIHNAAVFLIDSRTMEVLADVGSADFDNKQIDGEVDGTHSRRSPGSALKPFVYALAMEQGLIHPLSVLADSPHSFAEYNPENFDRDFLGPIKASDALAHSRNVPAVSLAAGLSHPTFYGFLKDSEVSLPHPESFYGLTLPLGGAEISLQDLVRLYAALANDGQLRPLRWTSTDPLSPKGRRILSPETSFLTLEMLSKVPRPEMSSADYSSSNPVFWKTGTSQGFHDAWSIAVFDHYVLGVWIGNFDGKPNNSFIGRTAAGPLLFQIIDSLRTSWPEPSHPHLPPPGANLKRVEFCAVSGDIPGPHCHDRVEGWFIPGVSPIKTCEIHREILVDDVTGLRVPFDDGTRKLRREVFEFWPGDLAALFEQAGLPRRAPPPFLSEIDVNTLSRQGQAPQIIAPTAGGAAEIALSSGSAVPLRAKTDAGVRELFWFANKRFIGKGSPSEVISWKTSPGKYELIALDDHGRAASCTVTVRNAN